MEYIIYDIETNDKIVDNVNRIHVMSVMIGDKYDSTNDYDKMRRMLSKEDVYFVGHNIQRYDIPCLEKVLGIKIDTSRHIDTLAISWFLYNKRKTHNLEDWGEELGFSKVKVDDWENLSYDEYKKRCEGDVIINSRLFSKQISHLKEIYEGDENNMLKFLRFISWKMFQLRVLEENPFDLDVEKCEANLEHLTSLKEAKAKELISIMPKVAITSVRTKPKVLVKKDGTMSANAVKFFEECKAQGLDFQTTESLEVIRGYDFPNPDSPSQIKNWLYSIGWKPITFEVNKKGKRVPQVYTKDKELCQSVLDLGDVVLPLDDYGVLKHRIGLLKGFLKNQKDGKIAQYAHGFSSTLRFNYGGIVNLPNVKGKYGEYIRSVFTFKEGFVCGSDLASLEDRCKQHYIYPYDPEYVKSMMQEDYDPHLTLAEYSKALTPEQVLAHKEKKEDHSVVRHTYKQVNYMAVYGVGASKLSEYLSIKNNTAKKLLDDYWGLNWSVKKVASKFTTKTTSLGTWILNPTNKFWYELRSEKDRFSAVNQSTGSFIFDLWFKFTYDLGVKNVSLLMHDEMAIQTLDKEHTNAVLLKSISKVNNLIKFHVPMNIDVKFGDNYAEVH